MTIDYNYKQQHKLSTVVPAEIIPSSTTSIPHPSAPSTSLPSSPSLSPSSKHLPLSSSHNTTSTTITFTNWQKNHPRESYDNFCKYVFTFFVVSFFLLGFLILIQSKSESQRLEDTRRCCQEIIDRGDRLASSWGLCTNYQDNSSSRKLLEERTFDGDEGIFDTFAELPITTLGLSLLILALAYTWLLCLQRFTTFVVFLTGGCELLLVVSLGVASGGGLIFPMFILIALLLTGWVISKKGEELRLACKIISRAVSSFRRNRRMIGGLAVVNVVYWGVAGLFMLFCVESFNVVTVKSNRYEVMVEETDGEEGYEGEMQYEGGCYIDRPNYINLVNQVQCFTFLWISLFFDQIRLFVVATVVGYAHHSAHHPSDDRNISPPPKISHMIHHAITTSRGTLAESSLVLSVLELFRTDRTFKNRCYLCCLYPHLFFIFPLYLIFSLCGAALAELLKLHTRFTVVAHALTGGASFDDSSRVASALLQRHFVGGFVTDLTSRAVMARGCVLGSVIVGCLAWVGIDGAYGCDTFPLKGVDASVTYEGFMWLLIFGLCLSYPMIGIFIVVMVNAAVERRDTLAYARGEETYQYLWVPPLAACFVGSLSMLLFQFIAGIILDAVDVLFFCFALERDGGVIVEKNSRISVEQQQWNLSMGKGQQGDNEDMGLAKVIMEQGGAMPGCIVIARPIGDDDHDPEIPIVDAVLAADSVSVEYEEKYGMSPKIAG